MEYSFMEYSWRQIIIIVIKLFLEKDQKVKAFHLHWIFIYGIFMAANNNHSHQAFS